MVLKTRTDNYPERPLPDSPRPQRSKTLPLPLMIFFTMEGVVLLAGALLSSSLGNTWLFGALLEHLLFARLFAARAFSGLPASFSLITSGGGTLAFTGMFAIILVLYLLAVRYLPGRISHRYILLTTLLLGGAYLFIPIVTSQDMFSYIAYARMGVVYHLDPLTTLPTSIASDPIYPLLYWVQQPSAYGPTWAIITSTLQWVALLFGFRHLLSMEMLLRVFGLSMHLGSTQLIWSISGRLQGVYGETLFGQRQRRRALLAFAWNPFLLLEACVNAHSDISILFFVLFALWLLLPRAAGEPREYMLAALALAVAACIKITLVLLLPGLLLFLWTQQMSDTGGESRVRAVVSATGMYIGIVVLLYAPFWQQGSILQLLRVSPATSHDVNSLYQFVVCLIASQKGITIPAVLEPASRIEVISHQVSMFLFAIAYGALCLRSLAAPRYVNTVPALIRWMATAWLLFCVVGSPWFWPWYTITLFGLLALIEADGRANVRIPSIFQFFPIGGFARLLSLSMFSLYSFGSWHPGHIALPFPLDFQWLYSNGYFPLLPHFLWNYFAGLWIWAPPLLFICAWFLLTHWLKNTMRWQAHDLPVRAAGDGSPKKSRPMRSFTLRPPLL